MWVPWISLKGDNSLLFGELRPEGDHGHDITLPAFLVLFATKRAAYRLPRGFVVSPVQFHKK